MDDLFEKVLTQVDILRSEIKTLEQRQAALTAENQRLRAEVAELKSRRSEG